MIKLFFRKSLPSAAIEVFIYHERNNEITFAQPVDYVFSSEVFSADGVISFADISPTLTIPIDEFRTLLKTVPEALVAEGFLSSNTSALGELKAVKDSNEFNKSVIEQLLSMLRINR